MENYFSESNLKEHIKDKIYDLAKKNAKFAKIYSEDNFKNDELDNLNLYIKFDKNNLYTSNQEYKQKDIYINMLNEQICPLLNLSQPMILKINFHDYHETEGVLTFGSNINSKSVLIPDLYQIKNYSQSLHFSDNDNVNFLDKKSKIVFGGSSTGNEFELDKNVRLNTCIWSIKDRWAQINTVFKITSLVQISIQKMSEYLISNKCKLSQIYSENISIKEQLKYRYILSIDGNTWSWDRPVWVMNSNSLLFKYESNNVGWYYPILEENKHYVNVNKHNLENKFNFFENNNNQAQEIIRNSNKFVEDYCKSKAWILYFKTLLEEINSNI